MDLEAARFVVSSQFAHTFLINKAQDAASALVGRVMMCPTGDGGVRFISENTDGIIYQRLAQMADGEVVSEF